MATLSETTDGPVLNLMTKRLRALKKKLNRITQMEESVSQGKTLNKEQEEVLRFKPSVVTLIDEYEKLRQPLSLAVQEELELAQVSVPTTPPSAKEVTAVGVDLDEAVEDLVKLVYFGCLFDVKPRNDYGNTMLMRIHERGCCLTYDYVTDDATVFLGEKDLDLISVLGGLVTSRPGNSANSHKNALQSCFQHAKLWLANSDQPVESGADITYAGLRERLNKILASEYFTTTPELKAPKEVAAAYQVPVDDPSSMSVEIERSFTDYEPEVEESANAQGQETETAQSAPIEELPEDEPEQRKLSDSISFQQDQHDQKDRPQEQSERDVGPKGQFQNSRKAYQNQRGGGRGGGRGGYPNARFGDRSSRDGGRGYQNGRSQYYDQQENYYPRNYYRNRDGRGGGGDGGNACNNRGPAARVERGENRAPDQ